MQHRVLAYGELLWDLLPSGAVLGGAPANCAFRLASLGCHAFLATRVGADGYGERARAQLAGAGMDLSLVQTDPALPTGTVQVTLDPGGQPDYFIVPDVAYDQILETPELLQTAGTVEAICFGTLVQRAERARATLQATLRAAPKALRFFDINLRKNCFSPETISESLRVADILKVNHDELRFLGEMFAWSEKGLVELASKMVDQWSLRACVVTLGANGALGVAPHNEVVYEAGYEVKVADTCGAGDAFSAAFLVEYLEGHDLGQCCRRGNLLGAIVSTQIGATEPVSPDQIQALIGSSKARNYDEALRAYERRPNS